MGIEILNPDKQGIKKAAKLLNGGYLVAFPTETVFGVGCVYDNLNSYKALNKLKQRKPDKPYTLMLGNIKDIDRFCDLTVKQRAYIKKVFPGSVTLILKAKPNLKSYLTKDGTIGIRVPNYPLTLSLLKLCKPLLVPSLNRADQKPLNNISLIKKEFNNELEAVINASCGGDKPSTVISLCGKIKVLREGKIPSSKLIEEYNKL